MKTNAFRLHRGQDLLIELNTYAKEHKIDAAVVISAVGCVSKGQVRNAGGVEIVSIPEHMEIVSLMGTLSYKRTHLHISFSKEDLSTVGGHLTEGCIVNTTAEIVLLELDDMIFSGVFDELTGYDELLITSKYMDK